MTAPERREPCAPQPDDELAKTEDVLGSEPDVCAQPARRIHRRRKRTRFAIPERPAIAVRGLWEQASDEERAQAHRYAMAILESWTGRASWGETAKKLGLPPVRAHQLSQQAVSGMLAGLLKQPRTRRKRGEPALPLEPEENPALLRKRIKALETKLARTEDLVRVLQEFPWHRAESAAGRRRKPEKADARRPARRKAKGRARARAKPESEREEGGGLEGDAATSSGA